MTAVNPRATFTEGFAPYTVDGETFQTYYKLFGSLTSGKRPLIALHGGPGCVHDYLLPLSDLSLPSPSPSSSSAESSESSGEGGRPILLYDQLGSGKSTHVRQKPKELFTIDLFANQIISLLDHFGIKEYDLIGHSWGGILASEFAVALTLGTLQPTKGTADLKSLILTNSLAEMKLWGMSSMKLLEPFGEEVKAGMLAGFKDPAAHKRALQAFHAKHGCLVRPVPEEVSYSVYDVIFGNDETGVEGDTTVPINMFSGPLSNWSIISRLDKIRVPVLVLNGAHDIVQDFVCAPFFYNVNNAKTKWVRFEKSSHVPFWEERERYMEVVGQWLNSIA